MQKATSRSLNIAWTFSGRTLTASLFFNMCIQMRITSQTNAVIYKFFSFPKICSSCCGDSINMKICCCCCFFCFFFLYQLHHRPNKIKESGILIRIGSLVYSSGSSHKYYKIIVAKGKCGHHHFFLLSFILFIATTASTRLTPPTASL